MATSDRRRFRYSHDETYRERQLRRVQEMRDAGKWEREREKRLRGWSHIDDVPDGEVVLIYDPNVFWPVLATLRDGQWQCIHYEGPEPRPTHWRRPLELPLP